MFMITVFWVICLNLYVNKEGFVHIYHLTESWRVSFLKDISAIVYSFPPPPPPKTNSGPITAMPAAEANAASQTSANQMTGFNIS